MSRVIQIKTTREDYITTYLQIINGIFKFSKTELTVLARFISKDDQVPCPPLARKEVLQELGFSSIHALNNVIVALREKGAFVREGRNIKSYNPIVIPPDLDTELVIKFVEDDSQ